VQLAVENEEERNVDIFSTKKNDFVATKFGASKTSTTSTTTTRTTTTTTTTERRHLIQKTVGRSDRWIDDMPNK
jgi:hypothetical protein